jgi:hypothetical protein
MSSRMSTKRSFFWEQRFGPVARPEGPHAGNARPFSWPILSNVQSMQVSEVDGKPSPVDLGVRRPQWSTKPMSSDKRLEHYLRGVSSGSVHLSVTTQVARLTGPQRRRYLKKVGRNEMEAA